MQRSTGSTEPVTCHGKKVFQSYYSADKSAKILNHYNEGTHAGPYRCPICNKWHVGNSLNTKRDKRIYKEKRDGQREEITD